LVREDSLLIGGDGAIEGLRLCIEDNWLARWSDTVEKGETRRGWHTWVVDIVEGAMEYLPWAGPVQQVELGVEGKENLERLIFIHDRRGLMRSHLDDYVICEGM